MCCNCICNCNNNFGGIQNNFGGGGLDGIGFSGPELGFGFNGLTDSEGTEKKIKIFRQEQERLGGPDKVVVGEVTGRRLNYKTLAIHIDVKVYTNEQGEDNTEEGFDGYTIHRGFIEFGNPAAFYNALPEIGYTDQYVAIDSTTGELVESFYQREWQMF